MHGTIGSYNISAFWYLPKYANRWNKYSKWRSMDWARCLLLIIEKPNKYLPDQAQLSIAAFIPIEDWQYIGRFLTWHSQLTSIWPILNLEGASARLGSVRPLKPVTPEHTSRLCWHTGSSQRPSTRRQCSTPLHEVDCQDALMASQWMPISLLNVIRLVVEQGFCNHIDHQHFVYTQQGIFHVHVASLKGRKQTQISIRQLKAKVIHTYLSIAPNLCLQHSFHEPLAR